MSIETISAQVDVSVGTVHTIIREELKMRKICAKFVPRVLREDQKERHCHDSRELVELINSDPAVLDALVTCDESWIYCYDPQTKRQSSQWKHTGSPRDKKARQSKSTHKLLMRTRHQSTSPSLSQNFWLRWPSWQFLTLPIVQTLLPVTFGYSLSSGENLEVVVMRQLRRWKRLWCRSLTRSHKRTSMGPSRSFWNRTTSALQPEEITSKSVKIYKNVENIFIYFYTFYTSIYA